jgi:hypothetical protein
VFGDKDVVPTLLHTYVLTTDTFDGKGARNRTCQTSFHCSLMNYYLGPYFGGPGSWFLEWSCASRYSTYCSSTLQRRLSHSLLARRAAQDRCLWSCICVISFDIMWCDSSNVNTRS